MAERNDQRRVTSESRQIRIRSAATGAGADRTHVSSAPTYRWVCPCQEPPVLLATYDVSGKLNIKVRDRYWHLYGFGHVHAICPRCGGEHLLDLRQLRERTARSYQVGDEAS